MLSCCNLLPIVWLQLKINKCQKRIQMLYVTDVKGAGEAVENMMLLVSSFNVTGLVVGQWHIHRGITDLCRLSNGSLPLRWCSGFLLVHNHAQLHLIRARRQACRMNLLISPDRNPMEDLWDIVFRSIWCQAAHPTVQELRSGRRTPSIISFEAPKRRCSKTSAKRTRTTAPVFHFDFRGALEFSPL